MASAYRMRTMIQFSDLRIKTKMILLIAAAVLASLMICSTAIYFLNDTIIRQKIEQVRNQTETAKSVVMYFADKCRKGELDEKTAKEMAKSAVRALRYGPDMKEYFFVYDSTGLTLVLGPKPELEGKQRMDQTDTYGVPYIKLLIESAKTSGQPVYYHNVRTGEKVAVEKIAASTYYEPWDWIIVTGVYMDDIRAEVNGVIWRLGSFALIVVIFMGAVAVFGARSLAEPIVALSHGAHQMSQGRYDVEIPGTQRRDEIGEVAQAFDELKKNLLLGRELEQKQKLESEAKARRGEKIAALVHEFTSEWIAVCRAASR